jgi:hypothetical protein
VSLIFFVHHTAALLSGLFGGFKSVVKGQIKGAQAPLRFSIGIEPGSIRWRDET